MDVRRFLKTVLATFSTEIGIHFLGFVTTILIVRNMSASDFGIYSLFCAFFITLGYLTNFGLPQAIVFFLGKGKETLDKIVSTNLFLCCCIAFVAVTICYLLKGIILNSFLKDLPQNYFILLLLFYFVSLFNIFLLSVIRGLNNFFLFNMRGLLTPALNLLCICIVYLFWGLSLKAVLTVFIAVNTLLTLWFFLKIKAVTSFRFSIDWLIVKSLFSYGLKSYTQTLTGHLIYQIDIYIIAYLLGARQVAFYAIAVGIATLLWYIPNTVGVVLFPTLSSVKDDNKIHEFSAQVCRHTMFITSLAALALGLAGKYIILFIYGAEYNNSVNSMLLILPGIIVMSLYKVLTRNFSSRNKQQVSIMAAGIALVVNIGLNLLWIPQFGIEGAALASTVSYILASTLLVIKVRMESDLTIREMLFVNRTDLKYYSGIISKLRKIY